MLKLFLKNVFFLLALCFLCASTCAEEMDFPLIVKSKYFSVYGDDNLDINSLLSKLNFEYFFRLDSILESPTRDKRTILSRTLDSLYLEVSDILDIHIYSYHGIIKILPDTDSVSAVFEHFFGSDFEERSFYIPEQNTIYISFRDITLGMLGHEISHAIQSRYFVVPPPAKVQEVLSGYVEYNLRKATGTLPR